MPRLVLGFKASEVYQEVDKISLDNRVSAAAVEVQSTLSDPSYVESRVREIALNLDIIVHTQEIKQVTGCLNHERYLQSTESQNWLM